MNANTDLKAGLLGCLSVDIDVDIDLNFGGKCGSRSKC